MVYAFVLAALTTGSVAMAQDQSAPAPGTAGQSAVSQEKVEAPKKRKVQAEIYNRYEITKQAVNNQEANVSTSNYLGIRYNLDDNRQISVRQTFSVKPRFRDTEEKSSLGDTYLHYGHSNLLKWGTDGHLDLVTARVYAPTSYASRMETGQNIRALTWIAATGKVGKWDVTFYNVNDARQYSKDRNLKGEAQLQVETSNSLGFGYDLTKNLSIEINPGFTNDLMVDGSTKTSFDNNYYLTYSMKPLTLMLGVEDSNDVQTPKKPFQLFQDENIGYKFLITAVL